MNIIVWFAFGLLFAIIGWVSATGVKAQWVRLLDVFIYGPYLIYLSLRPTYIFSTAELLFILCLGTTTITYNARNYLKSM